MRRSIASNVLPMKFLIIIAIFSFASVLAQAPKDKSSTPATSTTAPSKTSSQAETTEKSSTIQETTSSESPAETTLPALTTTTTSESGGLITGLPKLAQDDYPPPTVPPTANAPYMQKSTLPEGTVFIAVGAFLAFVTAIVIAWRGLVAWSIHRSVRRAALAQSSKYRRDEAKHTRSHSKAPLYNAQFGSTLSIDRLRSSGKGRNHGNATRESLFFSPTAGGGMQGPLKRGSGYLPAGYYAAGNSTPGGGMGMTHLGGGGTGLGNPNTRYSRARSTGPSPPHSPSLPPSRGYDGGLGRPSTAGISMHTSNSSLNLSVQPQGRAPSAYLEDLFESHPHAPNSATDRRIP